MNSKLKVFMVPTFHSYNKYSSALVQSIEEEGIHVKFIPYWTRTLPVVAMLRTMGLPHVIHLHWIETYTIKKTWWNTIIASTIFVFELLFLKALGPKIVWTIHDSTNVDGHFNRLDIVVRRITAGLADSMIVHTEAARRQISALYRLSKRSESKIKVIPHGHFIEQYPNGISRCDARETLGLEHSVFVFGFIGYLRPYKGVLELIEAFRRLEGDHIRLVIAGMPFDTTFADSVKETAGDDRRIQLHLEFIPEEKLQNILNAVDVLVFPYSRSLTSGSLILAMSFGKAVVAANHATVREVLASRGGILYATNDFGGLVGALREIQSMDVVSMGAENRKRAEAFGWRCIAKKTVEIYRRVIGEAAA